MNEQDAPPTHESPEQPPELPPIPDGGLTKGLPSWLAAPPARPSKLAGEPTPLDLQTLAGSAELPHWLDDLSDRVDRDAGETHVEEGALIAESPVEEQAEDVEESPVQNESAPVTANVPAAVTESVEPVVAPSEPMKEINTPEPRPLSTYLLYVLAVVIVVALAAWLIWG